MTENLPVPAPEPSGQVVLYQSQDGTTRIDVRLEGDTVWLPQRLIAELFQVSVPTVNEHLKGIYDDGKLSPGATIRKFRIVQTEGNRQVTRHIDHYNLDAIIAVGFRVRSPRGTQFRIEIDGNHLAVSQADGPSPQPQSGFVLQPIRVAAQRATLGRINGCSLSATIGCANSCFLLNLQMRATTKRAWLL